MNIEAQLLNKCYGSKQVLKDISLTLAQNKIYGLLGRNGAGKTTLM
nr:ATP-binding cassette domain-containing protein [Priestia megaterium]